MNCDTVVENLDPVTEELTLVEEPVLPPPESFKTSDLLAEVQQLAASAPEGSQAAIQAARLLGGMERAVGPLKLETLLSRQPYTAGTLTFPKRADALCHEAHRRMERSEYQFPAPALLLRQVRRAVSAWNEADAIEVTNRFMYALSRLNMNSLGYEVSVITRRIMTEPLENLETALKTFLEEARRGRR